MFSDDWIYRQQALDDDDFAAALSIDRNDYNLRVVFIGYHPFTPNLHWAVYMTVKDTGERTYFIHLEKVIP